MRAPYWSTTRYGHRRTGRLGPISRSRMFRRCAARDRSAARGSRSGSDRGSGFSFFRQRLFRLRIMLTDSSAPAGVYRLLQSPAGRGALVAACLAGRDRADRDWRAAISKGAIVRREPSRSRRSSEPLPGDVVEVEPGWVAVNGVKFPNSQTAAARQRRPAACARVIGRTPGRRRARSGCSVSTTRGAGMRATSDRCRRQICAAC